MSAYTTKTISREMAINLITQVAQKEMSYSDSEIERVLNKHVASGKYNDVLGCLINYSVE